MSSEAPSILVRCPAKLNLFLEVVRRREDGYHEIDTVMQAVDLFDELSITPRADSELRLTCTEASLPTDERNLVVRAARALREATGHRGGAGFHLVKNIPTEAGLGGGSSDAAGALVGLNAAWGLGLTDEALAEVAARVGSDVAFFLRGGTARCTGRGERVEPLAAKEGFRYVLVCPGVSVSTAAAYGKLRFPLTPFGADVTMTVRSVVEGDVEGLGRSLFNRLEEPAFAMHPVVRETKRRLEASGLFAGVAMTGSGSALFGLCRPKRWEWARDRIAALHLGTTRGVESIGDGAAVCLLR